MPRDERPPLGRQLLACLERVTALMEAVESESEMKRLRQRRARLLKLIGALVDENLEKASQEYRDATEAVEAANVAIGRAIRRLDTVAAAIKALGQALDLVATLVPA
jgi:hypothetical protein